MCNTRCIVCGLVVVLALAAWPDRGVGDVHDVELTQANIDKQPFEFQIGKSRNVENVHFRIAVRPRARDLAAGRQYLHGSVHVTRADTSVLDCLVEPRIEDDWLVFRFTIGKDYVGGSRFAFSDVGPMPGGEVYGLQLDSPLVKFYE